jgi:hypothetical protein
MLMRVRFVLFCFARFAQKMMLDHRKRVIGNKYISLRLLLLLLLLLLVNKRTNQYLCFLFSLFRLTIARPRGCVVTLTTLTTLSRSAHQRSVGHVRQHFFDGVSFAVPLSLEAAFA